MDLKRQAIRSILAGAYRQQGYGYGGYGGGKKYKPQVWSRPLKTGVPVEIPFRQQRIFRRTPEEPIGLYIVQVDPDEAEGVVKLKRPLVVPWGAAKGPDNWAVRLNKKYGTRLGSQLQRKLIKDRYDGIITVKDGVPPAQLDLIYDRLKKRPSLKGRIYQIVVFDDTNVEINLPRPEDILNRYFEHAPSYDSSSSGANEFYSHTLGEFVDSDGLDQIIDYKENEQSDIEYALANARDELKEVEERVEKLNNIRDLAEEYESVIIDIESEEQDLEGAEEEGDEEYADRLREDLKQMRIDLEDRERYLREELKEIRSLLAIDLTEDVLSGDFYDLEKALIDDEDNLGAAQYDVESYKERLEELRYELSDLEDEKMSIPSFSLDPQEEDQILRLSGFYGLASQGYYDVVIEKSDDNEYKVSITGDYIDSFERVVDLDYMEIKNEHLALTKDAPEGMGTRILYSQALAAKAEGFSKISCQAARGMGYVGYYTWARLGYNGSIKNAIFQFKQRSIGVKYLSDDEALDAMIREGLFPEYIKEGESDVYDVSMSDLMMTKEGAAWWKANGDGWAATFDLEDQENGEPSRAMQVISSYVKLKQKARGKTIDKWAYMAGPKGSPEIKLTEEDLYILDIVWDKVREREEEMRDMYRR